MRAIVITALALAIGSGCGVKVRRLVGKGRYAEAVAHAESKRRYPRREAARAFAYALIEVGRTEEARGVLLRDYRRGGQLPSLVMLADLEAELGLRGIAAAHYARTVDLDRDSLRGREDVCALLRQRAGMLLKQGEALAAEADLQRVDQLCPKPRDAAVRLRAEKLARSIDRAADQQVKQRIANTRCPTSECTEPSAASRIAAVQAELREARLGGPVSIVAAARRFGAEIQVDDLLAVITAELKGELDDAILLDDDVRLLLGAKAWADVAPKVGALEPEANAWVQLRLSTVLPDMPVAPPPPLGPSQLDRWAERAVGLENAQAWRAFAWRGDLRGAELALASTWRARAAKLPAPAEAGVDAPAHWGARVQPGDEALAAALVAARLRAIAGQEDLALELARFVLAKSVRAGVPTAARQLADEVARHVAWGRPWHALALADAVDDVATRPARAAAASAVVLTRAFCGGSCRADADFATVERVMGTAWAEAIGPQLEGLAFGGARDQGNPDGCPTPGEVLAADADSTLARALRRYRHDPAAPGVARQLRAAVEEDITLVCAARYALPVMAHADFSVSAGQTSEALAYDGRARAANQLSVHARLAEVAGEDDRTEMLAVEAGATTVDPRATWGELARFFHRTGNRNMALTSWRELIMHTPGLRDDVARRELVVLSMHDLVRAWGVGATQTGREAVAGHVSSYLAAFAPEQRHDRRRRLALRVLAEPWAKGDAAASIRAALYGDLPPPPARAAEVVAAFDGAWLAEAAEQGTVVTVPTATELFADPARLGAFRLALAEHTRDFSLRWRTAIGLMVYGTLSERALAARQLLELAEPIPRNRADLESVLLASPAALAPTPTGPSAATVIAHDDLFVPLWMELDLAPALLAR